MQITPLKIYDGKNVVKEYRAETLDLSFGVVEDILDALDFENMTDQKQLAGMIVKASKQLRPFLRDVFDGVTDDEIRHTRINNLVSIFKDLYSYAMTELGAAAGDTKN